MVKIYNNQKELIKKLIEIKFDLFNIIMFLI